MARATRYVAFLCLLVALAGGCQQQPQAIQIPVAQMIQGHTMGTTFAVKYMPVEGGPSQQMVEQRVDAVLESVNAQMSTYIASSELSRFNTSTSTDWFDVSVETAQVAQLALEISKATDGAFDITVGPVVDLWGFGPSRRRGDAPEEADIAETMQRTGSENLDVRLDPPALRKKVASLRVDMNAIAKGHGVDRVADELEELGLHSYFVEIGGEIRASGFKGPKARWKAGVEKPIEQGRELLTAIELSGQALASSGNYRNFYILDGEKYWHTIDPRTGKPAPASILQASVVASTCAEADAIATSMMVLGDEALTFAEANNWNVMLVRDVAGDLQVGATEGFSRLLPQDLAVSADADQVAELPTQ